MSVKLIAGLLSLAVLWPLVLIGFCYVFGKFFLDRMKMRRERMA